MTYPAKLGWIPRVWNLVLANDVLTVLGNVVLFTEMNYQCSTGLVHLGGKRFLSGNIAFMLYPDGPSVKKQVTGMIGCVCLFHHLRNVAV
ncbi:MAG: hypothetical protein BWX66_01919 [Deltaproteobacteria bacterium ADurb.Bin058]|nr:MAG: hypothetical protein BWX66_01919 [Deltaproteobacteria bacterium ADurb.Bin058]